MKRITLLIWVVFLIITSSCKEENITPESLNNVVESFEGNIEIHGVIACAANNTLNDTLYDIYFYPTPNSLDFKYYESNSQNIDEWDYNNYFEINLPIDNVFNGYLRKFSQSIGRFEKWGIVTFEKDEKLYISDPIRNQPFTNKTEVNPLLVTIINNGINPIFQWIDGQQTNNDIYFQVVSNQVGDLVSGTYTTEKSFTFYNLSNVVLNINEGNTPSLESNTEYNFTLMAVDDDNWVNLLAEKSFTTQ